ncbi:MAG TPA: sulfatase-like hydrolase/transferase [Bacteroidales bacterium]|nr:sulfatase-like hydrolase/transferase [Bacteroidales bacterium]
MKSLIFRQLRLFFYWLLVFLIFRLIFFAYNLQLIGLAGIRPAELLQSCWVALPLDIATASYLLMIALFADVLQLSTGLKLFRKVKLVVVGVFTYTHGLISIAETGLYAEWQSKLTYKVFIYFKHPDEIVQTAPTAMLLLLTGFWLLAATTLFVAYSRLSSTERNEMIRLKWPLIPAFVLNAALLFLGARGGLAAIPISVSSVYFSQHNILNLAAVNPTYHFAVNLINAVNFKNHNPYEVMPRDEAEAIVSELFKVEKDTTLSILAKPRPNVVVLLLESFSADLIASLGGEPGITPNIALLENEGLMFTNFYANANRSQQAIGSLIGGLPGIPVTTITNHPEKYYALPSLTKELKQAGYHTSFYFGGQLNYGNIRSYLIYNEIDLLVEGKDLPSAFRRGKLGVHDGDLLPYFATNLNQLPEPFFSVAFTLSSHAPYDFPGDRPITWPELERNHVNGAYYTDAAIGEFFALARQQSWYPNTLFILVADHSKSTYRNHPLETFEYHKIPLLLLGPALNDSLRGRKTDMLFMNSDLPATILKQLGLEASQFKWSRDMFNPYSPQFAYFELNEGLGWKRPEGHFVWNRFADHYWQNSLKPEDEERVKKEGKAFLQVLFQEFINY